MAFTTAAQAIKDAQGALETNKRPFRSIAQCEAFIGACDTLIALRTSVSGTREANFQYDVDALFRLQESAQKWLDANGGGSIVAPAVNAAPRVTYADFRESR